MSIRSVSSFLILLVSLVAMAIVQTHLKTKPTIILIVFTSLTILSFSLKKDKLSSILLLLLIALSSFCFWFMTCAFIKHLTTPPPAELEPYHRDMGWIWFIPIAMILSAVTIFFYFKKTERNKTLELFSLSLFLMTSVILFLGH